MSHIPKHPNFSQPDDLNHYLNDTLPSTYCEAFENLRNNNFKIEKILQTRFTGNTLSLYQFQGNDIHKFIVYIHIYSGIHSGDKDLIFGPYDGEIEQEKDLDKYLTQIKSKSHKEDKFRLKINEIKNLTVSKLKEKCNTLNLRKSGSKDNLIFRITQNLFKFNELM